MQAGTTFILPAPLSPPPSPAVKTVSSPNTLPDDPPTFQPEAYKPGSRITPTYNIPHPDPEAAAAEAAYKPPYLAWFALTVVCVGLPVGLFQGWAKSSIVKITSLRPSGRIKVFTTKDKLLRWVRKEGYVADTGVASEAFQPDGGKPEISFSCLRASCHRIAVTLVEQAARSDPICVRHESSS